MGNTVSSLRVIAPLMSIRVQLHHRGQWFSNLSVHQNHTGIHTGGLVKIQIAGLYSQNFRFSHSGVGPENLHFIRFLGDAVAGL